MERELREMGATLVTTADGLKEASVKQQPGLGRAVWYFCAAAAAGRKRAGALTSVVPAPPQALKASGLPPPKLGLDCVSGALRCLSMACWRLLFTVLCS